MRNDRIGTNGRLNQYLALALDLESMMLARMRKNRFATISAHRGRPGRCPAGPVAEARPAKKTKCEITGRRGLDDWSAE
jgi:hypothetical protein